MHSSLECIRRLRHKPTSYVISGRHRSLSYSRPCTCIWSVCVYLVISVLQVKYLRITVVIVFTMSDSNTVSCSGYILYRLIVNFELVSVIMTDRFTISIISNSQDPWNSLTEDIVQAPSASVASFERRLDKHWRNHPLMYNYRAPPTLDHAQSTPLLFNSSNINIYCELALEAQ